MKKEILIFTSGKLARVLGLSDRRIRALETEGVISKIKRGSYDLCESVQSYIRYQVDLVKSRQATGSKLEEETRLLKERADQVAMENEELRGEIIRITELMPLWQSLVAASRSRMLGIASATKSKHPDLDIDVVTTIDEIVRECLEDMSHECLPERYRKALERNGQAVDPAS